MSDSLRDQLLKTGLTTEQDIKRAKTQKHRQSRQHKGRKGAPPVQSEAARQVAEAEAQKRARDRTLNRRHEDERRRQADEKAARGLVVANEIAHGKDSDLAFNFPHGTRIKKIHVSPEQQRQLAAGELAIARTRGRYRLIPREVADKVRPMAPFLIAWIGEQSAEADDPAYQEHPIPDDLMW